VKVLTMILAMAAAAAPVEGPARTEKFRVPTDLMPRAVKVRVWLPPGFDEAPPASVPLILFLHDGYGSERSFFREGFDDILRGMIDRHEVPPIAVASPRTVGTFNSNDYRGRRRVMDFLASELVPVLLARYPQLRRDVAGRGLTGISLGGYGAVKLALRHPGRFGSVSAQSTWVEDLSWEYQQSRGFLMRWWMGRTFGKTEETTTAPRESLFSVITEAPDRTDRVPPLLLITGHDDPSVATGNHQRLEEALRAAGIRFTGSRQPGSHEWEFWRATFPEIVRFHASVSGRRGSPAPAE
jgi:enterochelin esterase-like enzyme